MPKHQPTPEAARQKLAMQKEECEVPPSLRVKDLAHLQKLLQEAVKLEHTTIPPYLCGLYSIREGTNLAAVDVILSVVIEEMLHMALASNVLNAVGGHPVIDQREFVPEYPVKQKELPGFQFDVGLERFCKHAMDVFIEIEAPSDITNLPDPGLNRPSTLSDFHSIAQFYEAIEWGLKDLSEPGQENIFTGSRDLQIGPEHYYGGGGKLTGVTDLNSALEALGEIIGQGEGVPGEIWESETLNPGVEDYLEVAHFYRFVEIRVGKRFKPDDATGFTPNDQQTFPDPTGGNIDVSWDPGDVYPMRTNTKMSDCDTDTDLFEKSKAFNRTYMALLNALHETTNGQPELMMKSVGIMYELKYRAIELMKIPLPDGSCETAGPSFEYLPPDKPE